MPEQPPSTGLPSLADGGCKARLLRHLDQCILEIDTEIGPATTMSTMSMHSSAAAATPSSMIVALPHPSSASASTANDHLVRPSSAFVGVSSAASVVRKPFADTNDNNSMDYSSQDSTNPLDFSSRNNKELLHQHLIAQGMMSMVGVGGGGGGGAAAAAAADEAAMRHHAGVLVHSVSASIR